MTLLQALRDRFLFARWFEGDSWTAWRVFLAVLTGESLSPQQAEVYRSHTGRARTPAGPVREAWVVVGRRGGKSLVAALMGVFLACFRDYSKFLGPGEKATVMLIAADRRQARVLFRYVTGFIDHVPMLSQLVVRRTRESLELSNRVVVEIHTASFRAVRGYTIAACICDEIAFWQSEESANPDQEIVNAIRPALLTIPGSLLLAISSPYAKRGVLWDSYQKHYGKDGDPVLVWQAATQDMNPCVDASQIETAYAADPAVAAAEYGGQFRQDIEGYVSREAVAAAVVPGRQVLPPVEGVRYHAFCDPSGGSSDSFTLAVSHHDKSSGRAVLDCVVERRPPFSPEAVVKEFASTLAQYRITRVVGDRYGGEWPREQFRKCGITYEPAEKTKSELYAELLPLLNSARVELLDNARLAAQLSGLERRTTRSGRDSIDHAPGSHDDLCNSAAGALTLAAARKRTPFAFSLSAAPAAVTGIAAESVFDLSLRHRS
jgi:hypothetical protein